MARRGSRGGHDRGSPGARVRADRVPALLPSTIAGASSSSARSARCRSSTRRARSRSTATWASCCWLHAGGREPRSRVTPAHPARQIRRAGWQRSSHAWRGRSPEPLFNPPRDWRERTRADRAWILAGPAAGRRGPRRERVGARRRGRPRGAVRHGGAVGDFARRCYEHNRGTRRARPGRKRCAASCSASGGAGSSRALGWDTMLPTSSCGTRLSPSAIGHTGFTGTSLWIDRERDLYVVLLTNRVHPSRDNEQTPRVRPQIHDAVVRRVRPPLPLNARRRQLRPTGPSPPVVQLRARSTRSVRRRWRTALLRSSAARCTGRSASPAARPAGSAAASEPAGPRPAPAVATAAGVRGAGAASAVGARSRERRRGRPVERARRRCRRAGSSR